MSIIGDGIMLVGALSGERTLSGPMVSFNGDGSLLSALSANITAQQSGSGDPSPTNVRPLTGFASAKIHVSPTQTGGTVYDVSFSSAGTVYGGTLNVLTGELTVTKVSQTSLWSAGVAEYAPSGNAFKRRTFALSQTGVAGATHSRMNCIAQYNTGTPTTVPYYYIRANGAYLYAWMPLDTDGSAEIQVVYDLATPQTYQLTAQQVATLIGQNYVWAECGDVTLTYTWRR